MSGEREEILNQTDQALGQRGLKVIGDERVMNLIRAIIASGNRVQTGDMLFAYAILDIWTNTNFPGWIEPPSQLLPHLRKLKN